MDNKSSNIKERILEIAEYKGISKEKFFEDIGMTYGNFKGKSKQTPINSNALVDILTIFPEINPEWLILGSKKMLKESIHSPKKYVNSNTEKHSTLMERGETQIIYDDPSRNPKAIPLYESDFFAGAMPTYNDNPEFPFTYIYSPGFEDCTFACRASGDSMEDKVHSGDIIVCKETNNKEIISYGDMYLVVTKEHRFLKIIRKGLERGWVILRSYNTAYDDIDLRLEDILNMYLIKGVIKKTQI